MDFDHYKILHSYEDIGQYLMMDEISGELCLKKYPEHHEDAVYEYLKEHKNPHIPTVIDYGTDEKGFYVIEEYIKGKTLDRYMEDVDEDPEERERIIYEILDAVEFLHLAPSPIIHRDLKSDNILIDKNGKVYVIDYDAAKVFKSGETKDTELIGTIGIAAPEQYGFSQSDQRTDIYALGLLIKDMFPENKKYQRVADKAMKMDPEQRYSGIGELRRAMKSGREVGVYIRRWALSISVTLAALILIFILQSLHINNEQKKADLTIDEGETVIEATTGEMTGTTNVFENDESGVFDMTLDTTGTLRESAELPMTTGSVTEPTGLEHDNLSVSDSSETTPISGNDAYETQTIPSESRIVNAYEEQTDVTTIETAGQTETPTRVPATTTPRPVTVTPTQAPATVTRVPTTSPSNVVTATATPEPVTVTPTVSNEYVYIVPTLAPHYTPTLSPTPTPYAGGPTAQSGTLSAGFWDESAGDLTIISGDGNPIYSATVNFPDGYTININQNSCDYRYTLSINSPNSFTLTYNYIDYPVEYVRVYNYSWTPAKQPDTITVTFSGE